MIVNYSVNSCHPSSSPVVSNASSVGFWHGLLPGTSSTLKDLLQVGPTAPVPLRRAGRGRMQNTLKREFGSPSILSGQSERNPVSVAQRRRVTGTVRITGGPAVVAVVVGFPAPPCPWLGRTTRDLSTMHRFRKQGRHVYQRHWTTGAAPLAVQVVIREDVDVVFIVVVIVLSLSS